MDEVNYYELASGETTPIGEWRQIGAFAIMPYKTRRTAKRVNFRIKRLQTGEIATPPTGYGPGNDSLMMALYQNNLPKGYICYAFGADALNDPSL